MKIIGITATGYITETSFSEVKAILSKNDERQKDMNYAKLKIGTDLSFTHALERLTVIKDITLSGDYRTLGKLEDAKKEIEVVISTVKALQVPLIAMQEEINKTGLV